MLLVYLAGWIIALVRTLPTCAICCQVVTSAWWDGARCYLLFCFVRCKCDIYIHASGHDHVHFRRGLQVGLGLGQDWCKDHLSLFSQLPAGTLNYTLLAHEPGSECKKLYRCASLAMLQHVAVCCKTVTTTTVMSTEDCACLLPVLFQLVSGDAWCIVPHMACVSCTATLRAVFRFLWLIWALSALPVLLSIVHLIKPRLVARGSAALFAVLAVFQIFAANTFHDLTTSVVAEQFDDVKKADKARLVGFAVMAAMSLLMIILESFMGGEGHSHRRHIATEGGRAADTVAEGAKV